MPETDALAQTAAAEPSGPAAPAADATVAAGPAAVAGRERETRATLGRFEILGVLGEGGMGRVYLARDPELERKVALKVLHHAGGDAGARLLREARALAKLSHANVITVFDVGTVDGEDFVAMELIDGETLGEWLRRATPSRAEILAAFVAAGRGLAAAHAEGLVHRDFKPNNVLRSKAGKIVVTDFGLARASGEQLSAPASGAPAASGSDSRTATGALIGTPAYMAPEQWDGAAVGPAADQFAFCVALWEAFAGERPFRGETLDQLRTGVHGDRAALDATRIPRRLRAVLRRGLAVDPAARWPNVDTLLAQIDTLDRRATARRSLGLAALALAAVAAYVGLAHRGAADPCAPAQSLADVWSVPRAALLAAKSRAAAELVADDVHTLADAYPRACRGAPAVRAARRACLDGVLARLDGALTLLPTTHGALDPDGLGDAIVDPAVCDRDEPPHIVHTTAELANAFALVAAIDSARSTSDDLTARIAAVADHATDPCVKATALVAKLANDELGSNLGLYAFTGATVRETLKTTAEQCADEPVRALALLASSPDPEDRTQVATEAARFPSAELQAELETLDARIAIRHHEYAEGRVHDERALALYARRRRMTSALELLTRMVDGLASRGRTEDFAAIEPLVAPWRARARDVDQRVLAQLEQAELKARWHAGDVAGADAALDQLEARGLIREQPVPIMMRPVDVSGRVIDEAGAPVAGAAVEASFAAMHDSVDLSMPLFRYGVKRTVTDHEGRFSLTGARGWISAQAGDRRSTSVFVVLPQVELTVRRTGRLEGHVEVGEKAAGRVIVSARSTGLVPSIEVAPVRADGTFTLDRLPIGQVKLRAATDFRIDNDSTGPDWRIAEVGAGVNPPVNLSLGSGKTLVVIAKSRDLTRPESAMIFVYREKITTPQTTLVRIAREFHVGMAPVMTYSDSAQAKADGVDVSALGADDLVAKVVDRPPGEISVCGAGFSKQQLANTGVSSFEQLGSAMQELELSCTVVAPEQKTVTIELPPLRKLVAPATPATPPK